MFTLSALGTLGLGAWIGSEAFSDLASDLNDKRLKNRWQHVAADLFWIVLASCAVITACHNLTHIWIR